MCVPAGSFCRIIAPYSKIHIASRRALESISICLSGVFGTKCRNVDQARPDVTFGRCVLCIDAETPERMSILCRCSRRANLNLIPGYRTETDRAIMSVQKGQAPWLIGAEPLYVDLS
jgi:hypothetical protein